MIKEARIYDVIASPDLSVYGLRVLTTRKWVRGVRKSDIDVWLPDAGPSESLLSDWREKRITWQQFTERYPAEQESQQTCRIVRYANGERTYDIPDSRSPLDVLRELEEAFGTVTVMCWEDTPCECHRHILVEMSKSLAQVMRENFAQEQLEAGAIKSGVPVSVVRK
jgi:uncharacterized protein YeaO (DUF488 family)